MNKYTCKIATKEEVERIFNYEIANHTNDNRWNIWKEETIKWTLNGKAIMYVGMVNDRVITSAIAALSKDIIQNAGEKSEEDELVNKTTAYLSAFRTVKAYEGKGYFSKLYKFMEMDLRKKGYNKLTLGVEPKDVRNMKIYFKWGFDKYIKTAYETYPPKNDFVEEETYLVNYYYKELL